MKFSEMTYTRPDPATSKQRLSALTAELKAAKSYEEARKVFLSQQELMSHISTAATLASIRHSIDTRDEFYDGEEKFWNNFNPELEEYNQAWTAAMLESAFRADFEKEYGDLMFVNAEIALKTFSPAIIPELQQENDLTQEYEKLLASAQIPFEGKVYTLSQLSPFKTCADDEKRLAAWKAEGQWYKDNQKQLDDIYDKLTHLRDKMGKKLGYEGYTTLGYYRMKRNCYTKDDVEKFRAAVRKYLVPVAEKIYRKQVLPMLEKGPMSIAMKIPLLNTAIYSVIRKKLMDAFGGNVTIFIVGGAPMNQETESFLMKIHFPITIGYGMTECAPLISFTPDNEFKPSSCGRYLKGLLEVRIESSDPEHVAGEILVRGEHVMKGYYKNDKDTHKVLDEEGWLHTGDMATMDPDGTLYIRGRSKTMILSGNGQNIYPEEIEDKLNNMYLVLESLVLEGDNGRLKALVVPDYEQAEAEGVDKADLPQIMQNNLQELNAQLAAYERISGIALYPNEFEKTPKRSIKRYLYEPSLLNK